MAKVIMSGKEVADHMKEDMIVRVENLKAKGIVPTLSIVRLGERPDDLAYERGARKRAEMVGVRTIVSELPETLAQEHLETELRALNAAPGVHGILLFRPLPDHIDEKALIGLVSPDKDVDCMNPANMAKLFMGEEGGFPPCTPEAVVEMLAYYDIPLEGKEVAVAGRSLVVGKPLAMLLMQKNATVTVCHSRTKDLAEVLGRADIVCSAMGRAEIVTGDMIKEGAVLVDVGINVNEAGDLTGDCDFASCEEKASCISKVPGGVGSVTSSVLINHVIKSAESRV